MRPLMESFFSNSGETPAYKVIYHCEIGIGECPLPIGYNVEILPPKEDRSEGTLASQKKSHISMRRPNPLTVQEANDIREGRSALYFYGYVKYRDTFDIPRTTNFRLMYTNRCIVANSRLFEMCAEGNEAD